MPLDGRENDERPLFGPNGRIPMVQAVTLTRPSGLTTLRQGWLPRHTVAMIVLSPLLFLAYAAALGTGYDDPFWTLLLGGMSLVAALIVTTYLPLRGAQAVPGSSCTMLAGVLVPVAGVLLNQATGIITGGLALVILSFALFQRVSGASACG
ncbi:MAG: hypothetical protein ACOH1Y_08595 [Propionicimonas sp.]